MGVETLPVQSVAKLSALVAVLSVIAVAVMNLRLAARDPMARDRPQPPPGGAVDRVGILDRTGPPGRIPEEPADPPARLYDPMARLSQLQKPHPIPPIPETCHELSAVKEWLG